MTEYDYSPEAYERYLNTQRRIATWVDKTEDCRSQFANAIAPPANYLPGAEAAERTKPGRTGRRLQRRHSQHFRPRSPSVDSDDSSSEYDACEWKHPGPMPLRSAPGHLGGSFPAAQLPWNQPPPQVVIAPQQPMPPSYYGAPVQHDSMMRRSHSHRAHQQLQQARVYAPAPTPLYTPPLTPVYTMAPSQPGHITVIPTPPPHHRMPMQYVYL